MKHRTFHFDWHWDLKSSPEEFWPFIADTNRFNRDTGLPSLTMAESGRQPGDPDSGQTEGLTNARRLLQFHRMGFKMEWEEEPFEWVRPQRFSVMRRYRAGPIAEMLAKVELTPNPDGGTHLRYQVWATPRYWFGYIGIPMQIGVLSARSFDKAIRRYDEIASHLGRDASKRGALPDSGIRLASGGRQRIASARTVLLQSEDADLIDKLIEVVECRDDLSVARLRPYALADEWQVARRRVLELCLAATRAGLLEFQWELLCPLCRGPKQKSTTLRDVTSDVHCDACNIDFTANFERSVELTFHPNPAIRPLDVHPYCIGGPMVTPHIVAQQFVQPGETVEVATRLDLGRHRVRTYSLAGGQHLAVAEEGSPEITLTAHDDRPWPADEAVIAPDALLRLHNATPAEQLFIVERMAWSDQAATAAEVTALQVFRDLFSSEALRPGEKISVGTLAVVFTDLRESTRLYREIGDAPAFGMVMNHFDVLREVVIAEDGAIVKTMGDSVMAVFRRPLAALRAVFRVQSLLTKSNYGHDLRLKAGIHFGPCIAVNLNERLDYFGSTVNIASRLESLSSGSDVIISGPVRDDPEVAAYLATPETVAMEPVQAVLKGFEAEQIELWRVARLSG